MKKQRKVINDKNINNLTDLVSIFPFFRSLKRVEENNKFIFKTTSKALRNKFYEQYKLKNDKSSEIIFLKFYFK